MSPLLAEAVEKVPGSKLLETMIQSEACHRIKVAQMASVMNHCYENSRCSDFFNSLGYTRLSEVLRNRYRLGPPSRSRSGRDLHPPNVLHARQPAGVPEGETVTGLAPR